MNRKAYGLLMYGVYLADVFKKPQKTRKVKVVTPHQVTCEPFAIMEELPEVVATEVPVAEGTILADVQDDTHIILNTFSAHAHGFYGYGMYP